MGRRPLDLCHSTRWSFESSRLNGGRHAVTAQHELFWVELRVRKAEWPGVGANRGLKKLAVRGSKACQPFRTVCFFESEGCRSLQHSGSFEELWDIGSAWSTRR